jgi:hypothetical protein
MDNFDLKKYLAENKLYEDAKKQTAVEYLEALAINRPITPEDIKQAKEIEKKRIINAYDSGWKRANDTKDSAISTAEDHGEYYYNKLFN